MQTNMREGGRPPLPPHIRSDPIFIKDAHSAESHEKSIFRLLFFELWLIVLQFTVHTWIFKCVTDRIFFFKSGQIYRKDAE